MTPEHYRSFVFGALAELKADPQLSPSEAVNAWAAKQGLRRAIWAVTRQPDRLAIYHDVRRLAEQQGEEH